MIDPQELEGAIRVVDTLPKSVYVNTVLAAAARTSRRCRATRTSRW